MTGTEYAKAVAKYVATKYGYRGIKVFQEVPFGRTIIGKKRFLDILVVHLEERKAFALECKFQDSSGSADEKLMYALENIKALHIQGCVVYAGKGFSKQFVSLLESDSRAVFCSPADTQTEELDHVLAVYFGWWDIVVSGLSAVRIKDEDKPNL